MHNNHVRNIDNTIYPKKAVSEARMAYREYFDSTIEATTSHTVKLTISVKSKYENNRREVILNFWNYLLDRACQIKAEG